MNLPDRILDAPRIDLRRALVWLVVAVPFAVAWLVGKVVLALVVALSWVKAAMVEGYQVARGDR